jgi:5,10-methylenetetrahydrofolate reductase
MVYGPCGGVKADGTCEMTPDPCVFPEPVRPRLARTGRPLHRPPLVLTDFSTPPFDPQALRAAAAILAPSSDAVLVGEHQNRPDFPPTVLARLLLDAGCRPVITLACRDRNRIVLEQELRGLRLLEVDAVLCVTGDGRAYDVRPDVSQVFDLDGPRLAMLAHDVGVPAAVPEVPAVSRDRLRARRLVAKQRCGASIAVLNHVSRPAQVAAFVDQARAEGLTIPVIAAAALFTDAMSAAVLNALPGLELDPGQLADVLGASDPVAAGIEATVAEARELLAIDGVVGVNLSGLASARGWQHAAEVKAEAGARIREFIAGSTG